MKRIELFAVMSNTDLTEGRGQAYPVVYTEHEGVAHDIVNSPAFYKEYGVMGCPPYNDGKYSIAKKEIVVVESVQDYLKFQNDERRRAALAKLTPTEKELLGLT